MSATDKMIYFGPWDRPGHYFRSEDGRSSLDRHSNPWGYNLDGRLQPQGEYQHKDGAAYLHHKDGWTALAFWDTSVDERTASVSVYLLPGTHTFDEMVEQAKARFRSRWNKMKFQVFEVKQ